MRSFLSSLRHGRGLALLGVLAVAAASAQIAPRGTAKIDVRFGILEVGADGRPAFVETRRVPNEIGQAYGWIATLEPSTEPISWSEELVLPSAPQLWDRRSTTGRFAVSDDRTMGLTRGVLQPGDTELAQFWSVTAGDPSGTYRLTVKVLDGTVADFTFELFDAR
jgi:hypothetical protein